MALSTAGLIGRIGGFAIALGVGGAVATGLAAQAQAAPADSSVSASASPSAANVRGAAVSKHAAARRSSAAPVAARRSAALRTAPAATTSPRRSAAATATSRTAAVTAAQVTPSDIWNSLVTRIAGIFGWDPRGRLQTIYQNTHFTIPNNFGFFIQKVSGSGTFTPNTTYDLGDSDQWDWNKLTGIAFTPL